METLHTNTIIFLDWEVRLKALLLSLRNGTEAKVDKENKKYNLETETLLPYDFINLLIQFLEIF